MFFEGHGYKDGYNFAMQGHHISVVRFCLNRENPDLTLPEFYDDSDLIRRYQGKKARKTYDYRIKPCNFLNFCRSSTNAINLAK